MTQPISADQPISTRIERVGDNWRAYVDPAWFRYFVDVGDVDLTVDVSGILPVANGGTGVATSTGSGSVVLSNFPSISAPAINAGSWSNANISMAGVTAPAFLNGWVNFGAPYEIAGYWKDPMGMVHLRGRVSTGTVALAMFNLPAGYRPLAQLTFPTVSNDAFGFLSVQTNGDVSLTAGSNVYASLNGVRFRVDV